MPCLERGQHGVVCCLFCCEPWVLIVCAWASGQGIMSPFAQQNRFPIRPHMLPSPHTLSQTQHDMMTLALKKQLKEANEEIEELQKKTTSDRSISITQMTEELEMRYRHCLSLAPTPAGVGMCGGVGAGGGKLWAWVLVQVSAWVWVKGWTYPQG